MNLNPLIIYHRGRHGELADGSIVKENTLEAFARAVREGAEMIEFDVWNDLRVTHDPETASKVSLPEVLELIDGQCAVNIEIKSPSAAPLVLGEIERAFTKGVWRPTQVVLSTFHHETAIVCKRKLPIVSVGVVNDGVLLPSYIEMLKTEGIDRLHIEWANVYMDKEVGGPMLDTCRKLDIPIWVWIVNSVQVYNTVIEYGAEAVLTDRPDLLRQGA